MGQTYLIRKFKPYTAPVTSAYYSSYYYGGGGIGVGNLTQRYFREYPTNPDMVTYHYFKITKNINSPVPPYSYNASLSDYNYVLPIFKSGGTVYANFPLSAIEKMSGTVFNNYNTFTAITSKEDLREGYFRIAYTEFQKLKTSNGGMGVGSPDFYYTESWGTGNYPNGVTYTETGVPYSNTFYIYGAYDFNGNNYDGANRFITIRKNYITPNSPVTLSSRTYSLVIVKPDDSEVVADYSKIYISLSNPTSSIFADYTTTLQAQGYTNSTSLENLRIMVKSSDYAPFKGFKLYYNDVYSDGSTFSGVASYLTL